MPPGLPISRRAARSAGRIASEEGGQIREDAAESVLAETNELGGRGALGLCLAGEETARSARSHHPGADTAEEAPATDRTRPPPVRSIVAHHTLPFWCRGSDRHRVDVHRDDPRPLVMARSLLGEVAHPGTVRCCVARDRPSPPLPMVEVTRRWEGGTDRARSDRDEHDMITGTSRFGVRRVFQVFEKRAPVGLSTVREGERAGPAARLVERAGAEHGVGRRAGNSFCVAGDAQHGVTVEQHGHGRRTIVPDPTGMSTHDHATSED